MIMSNEVKVFKSCKITTVDKRDISQIVPPEFNIKNLMSRTNNAIEEVRAIKGGDNYDG